MPDSVRFAPVRRADDKYQQTVVVDLVDDAIFADANPPFQRKAFQFFGAVRTRIISQPINGSLDA